MKALTLQQPWASLVAHHLKKFETRSWPMPESVLGEDLAIHASGKLTPFARGLCFQDRFREALNIMGFLPEDLPLGAIVAVVRPVRCVTTATAVRQVSPTERAFGDFSPGRHATELAHIRRLSRPVPCRGALGIWEVPPDVAERVLVQVIGMALDATVVAK